MPKGFYITVHILIPLLLPFWLSAQQDSLTSRFDFDADFRFRIEQDWNSRKPDGTYRNDQTRFRYRFRAGVEYHPATWVSLGARLRTGYRERQQDPHLTLGEGFSEFGSLPITLEKAYVKIDKQGFTFWAGKNTFPFEKQNELFWSNNVYPDGVFLKKIFTFQSTILNNLAVSAGHFILTSRGSSLGADSYFEGFQVVSKLFNERIVVFPTLYLFRNIQNIPDGSETFLLDYSIVHIGTKFIVFQKPHIVLEADFNFNLENYSTNDSIPTSLSNERNGIVIGLSYGEINTKGDWTFGVTYTDLQRYAAVDFLAQNDWARWDYSAYDSHDGRLTNFTGIELLVSYAVTNNIRLTTKFYHVDQLVPYGIATETGNRIRLDLDVVF